MNKTVLLNASAFVFGSLFALGLMVSGLSNPEKVIGFLDIFGQWDASLAFVMIGAIMVSILPTQRALRQPFTIFKDKIDFPSAKQIDPKLISGAVLFGIGWGIAGICPAPSLTLMGLGYWEGLYFVAAMLAGIWIQRKIFA